MLAHAEEYSLDTGRIFAVGDSAGGHLLALYCCLLTCPDYAAHFGFPVPDALPKAVALNCGAYSPNTRGFLGGLIKDLMPLRGTPEELELIEVIGHLTPAFPPAYVMTAVKDFLYDDAVRMQCRLTALGVPNTFRVYDNADHTLGHDFHLNIRSAEAKECNDAECAFFREHG